MQRRAIKTHRKTRKYFRKMRRFLRGTERFLERNVFKILILLVVILVILIRKDMTEVNAEANFEFTEEKEVSAKSDSVEAVLNGITIPIIPEIVSEEDDTLQTEVIETSVQEEVQTSPLMGYITDIPLELEWYDFSSLEGETELLAKVIYQEARSGGGKEMYCVASVVLNRVRTQYKDFSDAHGIYTIHDVIYQDDIGEQYGKCTKKLIENWVCTEPESYELALEIASALIHGEIPVLPEYVLYQTGHHLPNTVLVNLGDTVEYYARPENFVY